MRKSETGNVPLGEKITYGFGNLAANLMITTANSFLTYYYTDVAGLGIAVASQVLLWTRMLDGISDLAMGGLVDRIHWKKGKARPWILFMAVPYGLALILLFSSPDFLNSTGKIVYAFCTYVLAMAGVYTATMVPYNCLLGTTTANRQDRGVMSTVRTLFGFGGATLVNAIVWPLIGVLGGGKAAWTKMGILFGTISSVLLLILYRNSKERIVHDRKASEKSDKIPMRVQIKGLIGNKYWLILIGYLFVTFVDGGLSGVNVYYAQWVLQDGNLVGILGASNTAAIMAGAVLIPLLMKKVSKRNLCLMGSGIYLAGILLIILSSRSFPMVVAGCALKGLGKAPGAVAGYAMLSDVVDYGERFHKTRNEGLVFSAATFAEKLGSGVGGLIMGGILAIGGYISNGVIQTQEAVKSIEMVFAYVPVVFALLSIFLMLFYDLDEKALRMDK